jgi:hypothetical protein
VRAAAGRPPDTIDDGMGMLPALSAHPGHTQRILFLFLYQTIHL